MKKYLILAFCAMLGQATQACGGWDWNEEMEYYSLLNQCWYLSNPELGPFLYDGDEQYHSECAEVPREPSSQNMMEWGDFFNDTYSVSDISECMYRIKPADFDLLRSGKIPSAIPTENALAANLAKGMHGEYLKYLEYAVHCGPYVGSSQQYSWGGDHRDQNSNLEMVTLGKKLYSETKSEVLKGRYAYQMIRLAHYAGSYEYALSIYEKYGKGHLDKIGTFKYYILDQMGGVYHHLGRVSDALVNFIKVFTHSTDRREGTLISIRITRSHHWEKMDAWNAREANLSNEDRIYYHLMAAMNGSSLGELKEVLALDPSHPVAEVLLMRVLKEAETEALSRHSEDLLSPQESAAELIALCAQYKDRLPDNDFYPFAIAYAHFLNGDYKRSEALFDALIKENKEGSVNRDSLLQYSRIAHIASFEHIDQAEESWLANNPLRGNYAEMERRLLGHKYLIQNDTVKAFLCARTSSFFLERFDLPLMEKVEAFYKEEGKSAWEQHLADAINPKDFLQVRGLYNLRKGALAAAAEYFETADMDLYEDASGLFVSNLRDFIWEDPEYNQGHKAYENIKGLSEIPELTTYLELCKYLLSLETRAQKGRDAAVCYEMLGSAFYNMLPYGYRRAVINSNHQVGSSSALNVKIKPLYDFERCELHQQGNVLIDYGRSFGYGYSSYYTMFRFSNSRVAQAYYEKALLATSKKAREDQARLTFALAKCQQALEFQGEDLNPDNEEYTPKIYFESLIEEYQDTEYYQRAYNSCTYLENYYNENY